MTAIVMVWTDLRDKAIEAFGAFPPAADESELLEAFQRSPVAVDRALAHVIDRFAQGKIRAPYRIWRDECRSRGNVSVNTGPDREKRILNAERWMLSAGLHFDRWPEVDDELFGERGSLREWAGDMKLVERMRACWEAARPGGVVLDEAAEGYAEEWRATSDARPATHRGHLETGMDRVQVAA